MQRECTFSLGEFVTIWGMARGSLVTAGVLACVGGVGVASVAVAAQPAVPSDITSELGAVAAASGSSGEVGVQSDSMLEQSPLSRLGGAGEASGLTLINDPNYWVFDDEYDSAVDSAAYPELGTSGMAVSKSAPDTLIVVGLGSPASDGSVSRDGYVGVLLDTNGDGSTDYGSVAPGVFMNVGTTYTAPVFWTSGSTTVDTGLSARWVRTADGWIAGFPWKAMGISGARFVMGLKDSSGDVDFSPNSYGTYVALSGVVGVTPTAPVTPVPVPVPAGQRVVGSVPSSVRAKRKKRVALPTTTDAGSRIRWTSRTKATCKVSGGRLVLTGKKGKCRIAATATGNGQRLALNTTYTVRLR